MMFLLKLLGADRELEILGRLSSRDENGLYGGVLDAEGEVNQLQHLLLLCFWRVGLLLRPLGLQLRLLAFRIY